LFVIERFEIVIEFNEILNLLKYTNYHELLQAKARWGFADLTD